MLMRAFYKVHQEKKESHPLPIELKDYCPEFGKNSMNKSPSMKNKGYFRPGSFMGARKV